MRQNAPQDTPTVSAKIVQLGDELRAKALRMTMLVRRMPEDDADMAVINKALGNILGRHRTRLHFEPVTQLPAYPRAFAADLFSRAEREFATRAIRNRATGGSHDRREVSGRNGADSNWHGPDAA